MRNRDPAPIQITAEQLLRDTKERQSSEVKTPIQKIQNSEVYNKYANPMCIGIGRMEISSASSL